MSDQACSLSVSAGNCDGEELPRFDNLKTKGAAVPPIFKGMGFHAVNPMKKSLFLLIALLLCLKGPLWAQEPSHRPLKGHAAHSSVYDSLAFSMASWGLGLAVEIGLLCALLEFSTGAHAHDSDDDD